MLNAVPAYDVFVSRFSAAVNSDHNAGTFRFGNNAYANFLTSPFMRPVLDTGISISRLNIVLGTSKEQLVFLDHSQRVSKSVRLGLSYHSIASLGFLQYQLTKNRSFGLDFVFSRNFYSCDIDYCYHKVDAQENGGILPGQKTEGITKGSFDLLLVNLAGEKWISARHDIRVDQKFLLSPDSAKVRFVIEANSNLSKQGWSYTGTVDSVFYKNSFLDTLVSFDTAAVVNYKNAISFHVLQNSTSCNSSVDYAGGIANQYLFIKEDSIGFFSSINTAFARLNYLKNRSRVFIEGDLTLSGKLNKNDKSIAGGVVVGFDTAILNDISISYGFSDLAPEYALNRLVSNHFIWNNNFENVENQQITSEATFLNSRLCIFGKFQYAKKAIYLNDDVVPIQSTGNVNVSEYGLKWNFLFWKKIGFSGQVTSMNSSKDFIRLPRLSTYSRISYKNHFFKNALLAEIGFAAIYKEAYFGNAYMPALGMYYLQNSVKVDGHPYLHFFANFTIGSAQLFLKVEHWNNGLFGGNSFAGPYYPAPPRTLKFGLIWTLRN
jgi:hypothetical protein